MSVHRFRRPGPDGKISDRAFDLLKKARRPVVLAGDGTLRKRACKQLRRFAEANGMGVLSTFMSKGTFDQVAAYCLVTGGLGTRDLHTQAIHDDDVVFTM